MSIYELPKSKKNTDKQFFKKTWNVVFLVFIFAISVLVGLYIGQEITREEIPQAEVSLVAQEEYAGETEQEKMVISVVEKSMPSVVSVIVKKTLSKIYLNYFGEDALEQIGAGTGFIVSEDGLIITNKHVVEDESAVYSILTNSGEEYDVEILSENPVQDIAILKIKNTENEIFQPLILGDSSSIRLGQTAIAIGNALGMYQNSISVGVISGLERDVVAQGNNGELESLQDIIQTDAAINSGNSGGPLLNSKGEVIAINTAVSLDGENIGFAVPINKAKRDLEQVRSEGKISYPFIGIRYLTLNEESSEEFGISVNYGAFIVEEEDGYVSIVKDSPAEKAGLQAEDIILEVDGQEVTEDNNLVDILQNYYPGDTITLKVLRDGEELMVALTLADWNDF
ncbi:MAG: trypsin-like peptidase domain-containing protein [Candidatus Pacebacteria bacterium]|nr:trypsin-like peptidase domain-containing protein [Candidatus Paceibacterota bacterium]MDD3919249.1 trypsin-like peptidase domain-containing protein [Candidatus Paceibacterota bacterium]